MNAAVPFNPDKTLSWINAELAEQRIVGAGLEVFLQGVSVLTECAGVRNSSGEAVTADTRFWIASMTKPVVSIVALKLAEAGTLSLSAPVSSVIGGFGSAGVLTASGEAEPVERAPAIRDLLNHTSGLTYGQFGTDDIHQRYSALGVFDYASNNAQMADRLCQLPLLYQPGTTFEYGMSTDLLGRVIEVVTGQSLERVLQTYIFEPLGMSNTGFRPDPSTLAELAPSVIRDTLAPDFSQTPTWFSGGAGLFSTVADYLLFARMLLGRGSLNGVEIVKPETFDLMIEPTLMDDARYGVYTDSLGVSAPWAKNGLSFGLGLAVRTQEIATLPGGLGEFFWPGVSGCNFWVDPRNDLVVVFMTHAPLHRTTHRLQLREVVYQGLSDAA